MPIPAEGNPSVGGMLPRNHGRCLVGLGSTGAAHTLVALPKIRLGSITLLPMDRPALVCIGGSVTGIEEGCCIEEGFLVLLIEEALTRTIGADPLMLS